MNTYDWLSRLVSCDTTSRNSNLELIDLLENYFRELKITTRITQDPDEAKANLLAIIPASDGNTQGGIVMSGHTDVVPVDGQRWETDPFTLVKKEGKLYGRGTADMKGFLAVMLGLVPEILQAKRKHPVYLAFSYDEEIGCRGAPLMIADIVNNSIKPQACIVGEPTGMRPVIAHKGIQAFRCRVQGHAAHSSLTPHGCNAIEYAAQLICYIRSVAEDLKNNGAIDSHFDVPFTTISTNMIHGGIAHNTIPEACDVIFEFRNLPQVQPDNILDQIRNYVDKELLPKMRREKSHANIEIDKLSAAPAFEISAEAEILQTVRAITKHQDEYKVAYATEAGLFQSADIPTIVCGPGHIDQAHRANEYVDVEQLGLCEKFMRDLLL